MTLFCAGISEEAYELRMRDWNWFFADATDTFPGSLAARVLQRILIGLRFMDDLMEKEDRLFVKRNHFFVPHTSTVLSAVVSSDIDAMLRARSRVRTTRGISLHRLDNNLVSRASEPFSEFAHVEAAITALGHHIPDSHDKWNKLAGIVMKSARDVWVVRYAFLLSFKSNDRVRDACSLRVALVWLRIFECIICKSWPTRAPILLWRTVNTSLTSLSPCR
jgi:hypothetical protein